MAYNEPPDLTDGTELTTNWLNRFYRDNILALKPETKAGDMSYYSGANTKARIGDIGAANYVIKSDGTKPTWGRPKSWVITSPGIIYMAYYYSATYMEVMIIGDPTLYHNGHVVIAESFRPKMGLPFHHPAGLTYYPAATTKAAVMPGDFLWVKDGLPAAYTASDRYVRICSYDVYAKTILNETEEYHQIQFDKFTRTDTYGLTSESSNTINILQDGVYLLFFEGSIQSYYVSAMTIEVYGISSFSIGMYLSSTYDDDWKYRIYNIQRLVSLKAGDHIRAYLSFIPGHTQNIDYQGIRMTLKRIST